EPAHVAFLPEDVPALLDVGPEAFEDAAVAAVLADEQDRQAAGGGRDEGGGQERSRLPDLEQEVSPDERDPERDPAQNVLDPLRAAVSRGRQHIRVEPA